jgi:hypothetical protein
MLTNEPGYIFVVKTKHDGIAGLFSRIETVTESIRMSLTDIDPNPELEFRCGNDLYDEAGVWLKGEYVAFVVKMPINHIAVGLTAIIMQ